MSEPGALLTLGNNVAELNQEQLEEQLSEDELRRLVLLIVASSGDKLPTNFKLALSSAYSFHVILVDRKTGQQLRRIFEDFGIFQVSVRLTASRPRTSSKPKPAPLPKPAPAVKPRRPLFPQSSSASASTSSSLERPPLSSTRRGRVQGETHIGGHAHFRKKNVPTETQKTYIVSHTRNFAACERRARDRALSF